jgi:hypothetical protein
MRLNESHDASCSVHKLILVSVLTTISNAVKSKLEDIGYIAIVTMCCGESQASRRHNNTVWIANVSLAPSLTRAGWDKEGQKYTEEIGEKINKCCKNVTISP